MPRHVEPTEEPTYVITVKYSGKQLTVAHSEDGQDGAIVIDSGYAAGQKHQHFVFEEAGGGYFYIVPVDSQKVLGVASSRTDDNTEVIEWTRVNIADQQFRFEDSGDGQHFFIIPRHSEQFDKVLTVNSEGQGQLVICSRNTIEGGEPYDYQLFRVGMRFT